MSNTRTIGLLGAMSIGIGGMVGGGIFAVLGEAVSIAHSATALAFVFAGIVAILTAYSYAKLSVRFQDSGGTIIFIDNAFKHSLLTACVNFILWLSYLVTISLYAVAFSSYAQTFFIDTSFADSVLLKHILISIAILLPGIINLVNAELVSKSETIVVVIKLSLIALVIVVGFPYVDFSTMAPSTYEDPLSIIAAGMIIFVAYEGFELIANAAPDIKNPSKNLPRAFLGAVSFVIVLYILIAIITVGSVSEADLLASKDFALAVAAKPALGQFGFTLVAIAALLATFSAINATIFGNARLSYALAKMKELPNIDKQGSNHPTNSVLLTITLSLLLANSIDLTQIAIIGSAGFLLIFSIVNLSAYKLRVDIGGSSALFIAAFILSSFALLTLLIHTYQTDFHAFVVFMIFVLISVVFETIYQKIVTKRA